ncbi:hypothetical protein [Streptomyces sp. MST-110588]|uniref:hypothetical protein n=1 Tax=Streptomyces sp. MST-110588 TaxID=2833628 RepID=UPI001F5E2413|nr:hypothetical protein [Streptomyces sp. MST-110588]UNO40342.1 hypothetical protein KGS77_13080 [Streptomyces sp. MST-110588]
MKPLLWLVLIISVAANAYLNLVIGSGPSQLVLQLVTGVVALASIAGLWMLRDRRS